MAHDQKLKAVITVLGSDRPGIVAHVASILADQNANILDISQTILQGIFTMTMMVEVAHHESFQVLSESFQQLSEELKVQITLQREEVFRFMHRL